MPFMSLIGDGMFEDMVIEKLRKLAMLKYDGFPESVRDYETHTHYFLYIWDADSLEEEYEWRIGKMLVIDMWFEGKFDMKEKITFDDLYPKEKEKCAECQREDDGEGKYVPPPFDKDTNNYIR